MAQERYQRVQQVNIANGAALSGAAEVGGEINASIEIVTNFTVAAAITFQGSDDGVTYYDVYDANGTEVSVPSHATHTGRAYELAAACMNFKFIKVRSGTSALPVNQTPGAGGTNIKVVAKT